jgi:hypothetical protein
LTKLNYDGYSRGGRRKLVFAAFRLDEFLSTFRSYSSHMPTRFAGTLAVDPYADNWKDISKEYRLDRGYECEDCGVN